MKTCRRCLRHENEKIALRNRLSATRAAFRLLRDLVWESQARFLDKVILDHETYEAYRLLFFRVKDLVDHLGPNPKVVDAHLWRLINEAIVSIRSKEALRKKESDNA